MANNSEILRILREATLSEAKPIGLAKTDKIIGQSKGENDAYYKDVKKKMSDYEKASTSSMEGAIEEPKFNYENNDEVEYHEDMEILNGMEMLNYERKPSEKFTQRAKEAIEGSSNMGNNPEWANVYPEQKGFTGPDFGKKLVDRIERSKKKRDAATPTLDQFGDDIEEKNVGVNKSKSAYKPSVSKKPVAIGESVIKEADKKTFTIKYWLHMKNDETEQFEKEVEAETAEEAMDEFKKTKLGKSARKPIVVENVPPRPKVMQQDNPTGPQQTMKRPIVRQQDNPITESEVDPRNTHFLVEKESGKILHGYDYTDEGPEYAKDAIKDMAKDDIRDMGRNPRDIKVMTKQGLIKQGIDPMDTKNWTSQGNNKNTNESKMKNDQINELSPRILGESGGRNTVIRKMLSAKEADIRSILKNYKLPNNTNPDEIPNISNYFKHVTNEYAVLPIVFDKNSNVVKVGLYSKSSGYLIRETTISPFDLIGKIIENGDWEAIVVLSDTHRELKDVAKALDDLYKDMERPTTTQPDGVPRYGTQIYYDDEGNTYKSRFRTSNLGHEFDVKSEPTKADSDDTWTHTLDAELPWNRNKRIQVLGGELNPMNTHFIIEKSSDKIVLGWDYSNTTLDRDQVKDIIIKDLKTILPNKPLSELKYVTKPNLIKQGIDPMDPNNWVSQGNNKNTNESTMKRLKFKKSFNGVETALKVIPETYKVNNKVFELTDGNEHYRVRWEGSLNEGKAVVLSSFHQESLNEDVAKIKHLMGFKSQDTLGNLKGGQRLTEDKTFFEMLKKTKAINEAEAKPDFLDLDKDGDKKEPMKKAAKDAKSTKKQGIQEYAPDYDNPYDDHSPLPEEWEFILYNGKEIDTNDKYLLDTILDTIGLTFYDSNGLYEPLTTSLGETISVDDTHPEIQKLQPRLLAIANKLNTGVAPDEKDTKLVDAILDKYYTYVDKWEPKEEDEFDWEAYDEEKRLGLS